MAFKKKLHTADPRLPDVFVETHRTRQRQKMERADARSVERHVRQLLANKISGALAGLLAVDPHRLPSWSKRQMIRLKDKDSHPAEKLSQTFFALDAQISQPLCFTCASSSRTAAQAAPELIQRTGEDPSAYNFKGFLCTAARDELSSLSRDYPQRWHIEEFFDAYQDQGWKRAGTLNLNIRYEQMTMTLMAQAAIHQLRQRIGNPWLSCEAAHLAQKFFRGFDGDIRVHRDTIVVTFYNAPGAEAWRKHFENLPEKLMQEKVNPCIPWLFNYKLDFQFK